MVRQRGRGRSWAAHVRRGAWPVGRRRWTGWWGDNPPYHDPVFVLTHYEWEPLEMQGDTTFHFVTEGSGPRSTRLGRPPAGGHHRDGGAQPSSSTWPRACSRSSRSRSLRCSSALGNGSSTTSTGRIELEQLRALEGVGVTHISYRVVRAELAKEEVRSMASHAADRRAASARGCGLRCPSPFTARSTATALAASGARAPPSR